MLLSRNAQYARKEEAKGHSFEPNHLSRNSDFQIPKRLCKDRQGCQCDVSRVIENSGWVGGCLYLTPPTKNPDELILISSLPFKSVSEFLVRKEFDCGKTFLSGEFNDRTDAG